MTTTETIMVPTQVEVNPIFDAIVATLSLDPFAEMQLVDVDGEVIDAMDRTLPPAWIWGFVEGDIQAMSDVLAGREAQKAITASQVPMSLTGAYRLISVQALELPAEPEPVMPPELPAVDPWASQALAAITETDRPATLTDTVGMPARKRFTEKRHVDEPTLLGLKDEVTDE